MKKLNRLIIAATVAIALNAIITSVQAGEPFLSPRAKSNQIRVVPAPAVRDPNLLATRPVGNAKAWDLAQSNRTVPSTGPSIDLAHATRPTLSAKDPRFETAWRENAVKEFQLAPLK